MERLNGSNDSLVDATNVVVQRSNANTFDASAQHRLTDSDNAINAFDSDTCVEKAVALIRTLKLEYPMLI